MQGRFNVCHLSFCLTYERPAGYFLLLLLLSHKYSKQTAPRSKLVLNITTGRYNGSFVQFVQKERKKERKRDMAHAKMGHMTMQKAVAVVSTNDRDVLKLKRPLKQPRCLSNRELRSHAGSF